MNQKYNELKEKHDLNIETINKMMSVKRLVLDEKTKHLINKMLESVKNLSVFKKYDLK